MDQNNRIDFFHNSICNYCKECSINLKRCSSCKTAAYCSKEHQISDWPNHKTICKVILKTEKCLPMKPFETFCELQNYMVLLKITWEKNLGRELSPAEHQMWMFPRICAFCLEKPEQKKVIDCQDCLCVSYCCTEHESQQTDTHKKFCKDLRLSLEIDQYLYKTMCYPKISLDDFINVNNDGLPRNIVDLIVSIDGSNDFNSTELKKQIECVLKTDMLTFGATILFAIEIAYCKNRIINLDDSMTVHIVGASFSEVTADWSLITELIFHWLPYLKNISYFFIGPEMQEIPSIDLKSNCAICSDKTINYKIYQNFYHDVIHELKKPNIVVAFNSGLHEFEHQESDPWKNSLPFLLHYEGVPLVLTSYTSTEMVSDISRLINTYENKITFLLNCERNGFSSKRPIRDWSTEDMSVFYVNNYISVVCR